MAITAISHTFDPVAYIVAFVLLCVAAGLPRQWAHLLAFIIGFLGVLAVAATRAHPNYQIALEAAVSLGFAASGAPALATMGIAPFVQGIKDRRAASHLLLPQELQPPDWLHGLQSFGIAGSPAYPEKQPTSTVNSVHTDLGPVKKARPVKKAAPAATTPTDAPPPASAPSP